MAWSGMGMMQSMPGQMGMGMNSGPMPPTYSGSSGYGGFSGGSSFPPPPALGTGGMGNNLLAHFRAVDVNGDGAISAAELMMAMRRSGWAFSPETSKMLVNMFDSDSNGRITFDEFERLHNYVLEMQSAYRQVDTDRNGQLDRMEVQRALTLSGYRLSPQTFNALFAKFDRHKRGTLGFDGYIELCVFIGTARNCFAMYDTNRTGEALFNFDTFVFCANQCNFL